MSQFYQEVKIKLLSCYMENVKRGMDSHLMNNLLKVLKYIKENFPEFNGYIPCPHDPYYFLGLDVVNGEPFLVTGSHGGQFEMRVSLKGTDEYSQGSCQSCPYRTPFEYVFRNDRLEEFLRDWSRIKVILIAKNAQQRAVFSDDFQP